MAQKKAARRRAAEKRARRARRAKSTVSRPAVEDQLGALITWMLEATGADYSAAAYFGLHGECTICRVRVGVVAAQFVDMAPSGLGGGLEAGFAGGLEGGIEGDLEGGLEGDFPRGRSPSGPGGSDGN